MLDSYIFAYLRCYTRNRSISTAARDPARDPIVSPAPGNLNLTIGEVLAQRSHARTHAEADMQYTSNTSRTYIH